MFNVGDEDFPWIVQAIMYDSSNPYAKIITESEAKLDKDGYVRFSKLAISDTVESFKIKYEFKLPTGLKPATFNPMSLLSNRTTSSTKGQFSCKSIEENLIVNEGQNFNISVLMIDKISSSEIKNVSWKVKIFLLDFIFLIFSSNF